MKVTIKLTIDFKVRVGRRFFFFYKHQYVRADFEGVREYDNLTVGDVISLEIFNESQSRFEVKSVGRYGTIDSPTNVVSLYFCNYSSYILEDEKGGYVGLRYQDVDGARNRLEALIAPRLQEKYGIVLSDEGVKVFDKPYYEEGKIPSFVCTRRCF